MPDQLKDLQESIRTTESAGLLKWRRHSGLDADTRELYQNYEAARRAAHQAANSAQAKVEGLRDDDTMNPAGRARLIREAITEGQFATRQAYRTMRTTLMVLDAHLAVVAQPKVDPAREALARDEIRTRFSGRPNPIAEMLNLAQQDSDMAAVLANGTFAESFLRGQGTDLRRAREAADTLRTVAAAAATQSADPVRRAAAEARAELAGLEGSMANTNYITRQALDSAREAAQ